MTEPMLSYFLSRVDKTDKCWLWKGKRNNKGSGYTTVIGRSGAYPVPRLSFAHFVRPIKSSEEVWHTCGNRLCVNPDHLYAKEKR